MSTELKSKCEVYPEALMRRERSVGGVGLLIFVVEFTS